MTEEQYKRARQLKSSIAAWEESLARLEDQFNSFEIPQEMYDRHLKEKREYVEGELNRMRKEFAEL